jgi:CTP:molybdopterin cytidylyltransferase MocA
MPGEAPRLHALLLAAGAGSRMGFVPKPLIELNGQPLWRHLLQAAREAGSQEATVVLGHHADRVLASLAQWPSDEQPRVVCNPQPGPDPTDSLHLGLTAIAQQGPWPERLLVLLADQPALRAEHLRAALRAFEQRPPDAHALVPMVQGQPGHPIVLDAQGCATLLARGTGGVKAWRRERPAQVATWPTEALAHVQDLDEPADLAALAAATGQRLQLPPSGKP